MNLAINNISPIRPDLQVVEPRVADLDDGYTRTYSTSSMTSPPSFAKEYSHEKP